jgi:predicted transcriptional regulator
MPFIENRPKKAFKPKKRRPWRTDLDSYQQETGNKVVTNYQQTGNKVVTKSGENAETGNKVVTNYQQSDNQSGNRTGNKVVTNYQQTGNKVVTKNTFLELSGLQRNCILFFFSICKTNREKETGNLSIEQVAHALNTSVGSVKMTINRLVKKKNIIKKSFKNGRGGWTNYELPKRLYSEILNLETGNKVVTNYQQTGNKVITKLVTKLVTNPPNNNNIYIHDNYYSHKERSKEYEDPSQQQLTAVIDSEWENLDITPLADYGLTRDRIKQLRDKTELTPREVEKSIQGFAEDLKTDPAYWRKTLKSSLPTEKLKFLIGTLIKTNAPYARSFSTESEEDPIDTHLSLMRARKEEREAKEQELLTLAFEEWYAIQKYDTKCEMAELNPKQKHQETLLKKSVLQSYKENIWPEQRRLIVEKS